MPSRRAVLGAAGTAGLGAIAAGAAASIRVDSPEPRSPAPATWPLDRFDAANTAANRAASLPDDPGVVWRQSTLGLTVGASLVVGPEAVYASDVTYADSVTALDRTDGTVRWVHEPFGGLLALVDGTVIAAAEDPRPEPEIRAFDPADGRVEWRTGRGSAGVDHLVAADGTVFIGGDGVVDAYRVADGTRRWHADGPSKSPTGLAVGPDRLYGTVGERLVRLRRRSWLQVGLGRPPRTAWHTAPIDEAQVPALSADRLVVAATVGTEPAPGTEGHPALATFDAETGTRAWGVLRTGSLADPPGHSVFHARHATVVDDLVVVGVSYGGEFRSPDADWPGEHPSPDAVVGRSLADGSKRWRQPVGTLVRDVAATGESVVVGTGTPNGGAVMALDQVDGSERWRREFDHGVTSVAPVDGVVFAVTLDGSVVALS